MSRKPTSAANVTRFYGGDPMPQAQPEPPKPIQQARKRVPKVRVEMPKPKQQTQPGRSDYEVRRRRALQKLQTSTEALSAEERDLLREYREINEIEAAWRAKRGKR